ncbi:MAG TPA: hypothetical protein PKN47_15005 [Nitrospira sp.]|jgi:hypothetical protein|nr:hypothetical protein [Nitrospira sp.]
MITAKNMASRKNARSLIGLLGIAAFGIFIAGNSVAEMGTPASEDKQASEQLAKGQRSVIGTVLAITSDQIKVDVGEVQPRFLPLKQAKQKSFARINEGDDLVITLNEQNLIVDFHPLTDGPGDTAAQHKIIRGEIAQALVTGQESVVIKASGTEQTFPIRSQVRSKVAAIPIGASAIFLIDETNQVADVAFKSLDSVREGKHQEGALSPIKNPHEKVNGKIVIPLGDNKNQITVRTEGGSDRTFEVREMPQKKLVNLKKGELVVLLIDDEKKVIDVAIPPTGQ